MEHREHHHTHAQSWKRHRLWACLRPSLAYHRPVCPTPPSPRGDPGSTGRNTQSEQEPEQRQPDCGTQGPKEEPSNLAGSQNKTCLAWSLLHTQALRKPAKEMPTGDAPRPVRDTWGRAASTSHPSEATSDQM